MTGADRSWTWVAALLALALVVRVMYWYPLLPDRFPIHFNGAGIPDRWVSRHPVTWSLLPIAGLLLAGSLFGLAAKLPGWAAHHPGLVNTAHPLLFQRLSLPGRRRVMRPTATFLRMTATLLLALFLYIVEGMARTALGTSVSHPAWPVGLFVLVVLGGAIVLVFRSRRTLRTTCLEEGLPYPGA